MGNIEKVVEFFTGTGSQNDVVHLLKEDHRLVEAMFKEFENSELAADKSRLLKQIVNELRMHTAAEEKEVYSLLKPEAGEKTEEALEEHHVVDFLLSELDDMNGSEDSARAKVKVLSEMVKHHVKEEENELLPALKSMNLDLDELGKKFQEEKENFKRRPKSEGRQPIDINSAKSKRAAAVRKKPTGQSRTGKTTNRSAAGRSTKKAASSRGKTSTRKSSDASSAGKSKSASRSTSKGKTVTAKRRNTGKKVRQAG